METIYKCPLCEKEYDTSRKLTAHLKNNEDNVHRAIGMLKTTAKYNWEKINKIVEQYDEMLKNNQQKTDEYIVEAIMDSIAEKKLREKENKMLTQKLLEKQKERKKAERAYMASQRMAEMVEEQERKKQEEEKERRAIKQLGTQDRPKSLIVEFYAMTHGVCRNWPAEIKLVKGLIGKYEYTPDKIRKLMRYMYETGHYNLSRINYVIDDYELFDNALPQINTPDTIPYYVHYFYHSQNMKMNKKMFVKEIRAIQTAVRANELTMQEVKNIIDGMLEHGQNVLMWFDNCVARYRNYKSTNHSNNPCTTNSAEREYTEIVNQLSKGKIQLKFVPKKYKQRVLNEINKRYYQGEFGAKYNRFEWAYRIGLPLDDKMIECGKNNALDNHQSVIANIDKTIDKIGDENKKKKLVEQKEKYLQWYKENVDKA